MERPNPDTYDELMVMARSIPVQVIYTQSDYDAYVTTQGGQTQTHSVCMIGANGNGQKHRSMYMLFKCD